MRVLLRKVPVEFIAGFSPQVPVILGGMLQVEEQMGFVTTRVKRHRWHKGVLKSNDPLIFSIGWRRFQSIPVYATEDTNDRKRFLKYTPEHMHCFCAFFGPMAPPNTAILAFQRTSDRATGFRISLTGTILELGASTSIVKKLKLVGIPTKVFKNTAFVAGMFNSDLEVAKFEGSGIRTVSGIRGQIKKAIREGEPGTFRATFEDKIQMSDIISCRLWVPITLREYYNPVTSLLRSADGKGWVGMRRIADIRKQEMIAIEVNKDSLYKPIVRQQVEFKKQRIPAKLQEKLPFASKPKQMMAKNPNTYRERRAVILDPGVCVMFFVNSLFLTNFNSSPQSNDIYTII